MKPKVILSDQEIDRRIQAARDAEKAARAKVARLKRTSATNGKRRETQRLCTLGRAIMSWSSSDLRVGNAFKNYLSTYLNRPADLEILAGTPWEVSRNAP